MYWAPAEHRLRGLDLPLAALLARHGAGPLLALGLGGALELLGATGQGPGAFLRCAQREPRLHLRGACGGGRRGEPVALLRRGLVAVGVLLLGQVQPLGELLEGDPVRVERLLGGAQAGPQPLDLGDRRAGGRVELAELDGDGAAPHLRGLAALGDRGEPALRGAAPLPGGGQRRQRLLDPAVGRGDLVGGLVDGGLDLQQGRRGRRSAADEPRADDVSLERDRRQDRLGGDEVGGRVEVRDDGDTVEQAVQRGAERGRHLHERPRPACPGRRRRAGRIGEQRRGR